MEAKNNVLVLYDSRSGNTAKMAELAAEGASAIPGIEVRTRSIDEATAEDVVWCDGLVFCTSWTLSFNGVLEFSTNQEEKLDVETEAFNA